MAGALAAYLRQMYEKCPHDVTRKREISSKINVQKNDSGTFMSSCLTFWWRWKTTGLILIKCIFEQKLGNYGGQTLKARQF